MSYQVKWIEDNFGITRKTLRIYEAKGLLPKNQGRAYRSYSEEDLDKIWAIKMLQGIGFSLQEIKDLGNCIFDSTPDQVSTALMSALDKKIATLEKQIAKSQQHLGYAQMIHLTGRIPLRPRGQATTKAPDFLAHSIQTHNVNNAAGYQVAYDLLAEPHDDSVSEEKLLTLFESLLEIMQNASQMKSLMGIQTIQKAILARMPLGPMSAEVQVLVKVLYDLVLESRPCENPMTPQVFSTVFASAYMEGLAGQASQTELGCEQCAFIADAISVFGGYANYEALIKQQ